MEDPILTLISNRYDIDHLIKEPISGDYWWLKALTKQGVRIGITECCEYGFECAHHKEYRNKIELQNKLN